MSARRASSEAHKVEMLLRYCTQLGKGLLWHHRILTCSNVWNLPAYNGAIYFSIHCVFWPQTVSWGHDLLICCAVCSNECQEWSKHHQHHPEAWLFWNRTSSQMLVGHETKHIVIDPQYL